jgi:hypothetical protein
VYKAFDPSKWHDFSAMKYSIRYFTVHFLHCAVSLVIVKLFVVSFCNLHREGLISIHTRSCSRGDYSLLVVTPRDLIGNYQSFGQSIASIFMVKVYLKLDAISLSEWRYSPTGHHNPYLYRLEK